MKKSEVIERALADLEYFIRLVQPIRLLGQVHKDLITWWTRQDARSHQLVLLPRDHQKSAMVAFRVAWEITKNPAVRVMYISSTAKLATKQLKFIKDILTCDAYRKYWPEMVFEEESKREKWTETEIAVDHPARKDNAVRDPTVFTAGLTTNVVGLHCDIAVYDDVVVHDNTYEDSQRKTTEERASYLASIAGTDSLTWVVGTRYHPKDLYNKMQEMVVEVPGDDGETEDSYPLYETFERVVEDRGDGSGQFLWPRAQAPNGKYYGFDKKELAKKRAQYSDPSKFRAQYYNNPNDVGSSSITQEMFQHYDKKHLHKDQGRWYYKNNKLNIFAAVDFAFSLSKKADYTCVIVVGVDAKHNYYVLDVARFKTTKISEYFDHILTLHTKWDFRKIRAEVNVAQEVIVKDLKDNYIRPYGLALVVDSHRPTVREGTKEERIEATLQPKYANRQMWHYSGGGCELLEQELIAMRPAHDDIKDALACCLDVCVPPSAINMMKAARQANSDNKYHFIHSRFGGVS